MKVTLRKYAEALASSLSEGEDKKSVERKINNMIRILAGKKEMKNIRKFKDVFQKVWLMKNNKIAAKVTLPYEPSQEEEKNLRKMLSEAFGKEVMMEVKVDGEVIGGMKVEMDDYVIDGTIAQGLLTLKSGIAHS